MQIIVLHTCHSMHNFPIRCVFYVILEAIPIAAF